MKINVTTNYNVGDKVYEVKDRNVFVWTIGTLNVETDVAKFLEGGRDTSIIYYANRKEKTGLLKTTTEQLIFTEEDRTESIFSSKEEAMKYIENLKEASKMIKEEVWEMFIYNEDLKYSPWKLVPFSHIEKWWI